MKVNGEIRPLQKPVSLQTFLEESGYQTVRIAVERNGEIVPKAAYADTILEDSDSLEIVSFVGGG